MCERHIFDSLYMVTHNSHEIRKPNKSHLLDNCDAYIGNHMGDVSGDILIAQTTIDVLKSHSALYEI